VERKTSLWRSVFQLPRTRDKGLLEEDAVPGLGRILDEKKTEFCTVPSGVICAD
jgi:hypothetical protein